MKILLVNKFLFRSGGSEACLFDGARLLKERGHRVAYLSMQHPRNTPGDDPAYLVSHVDFNSVAGVRRAAAAGRVLYSREARALMKHVIRVERPDIALLHNIYHQLSPSILSPLRKAGIPALMTLHDYKMVCPVYTLFSGGRPCERCRNGAYWWCVAKRCSKGSLSASLLAAVEMLLHHRVLDSYRSIAGFLSPSRFLMDKLHEMGFSKPLHHVPNFIDARDLAPRPGGDEGLFVYFGRLTPEKGLRTLIAAMAGVPGTCHIIGDGPLGEELRGMAAEMGLSNVLFFPHLPFSELACRVRRATAVVLPSEWYENSPRSVLEAFALGKAVIGSRIGGIPELVQDGVTGFTFAPGAVDGLRRALLSSLAQQARVAEMGRNARRLVEMEFGPDAYYERLMALFQQALGRR